MTRFTRAVCSLVQYFVHTTRLLRGAGLLLVEHQRRFVRTLGGRKAFVIDHAARPMCDLPENVTLDGVVGHLWKHRSSERGDDVADPYRRGPDAMQTAADQIDGSLDVMVGELSRLAAQPCR